MHLICESGIHGENLFPAWSLPIRALELMRVAIPRFAFSLKSGKCDYPFIRNQRGLEPTCVSSLRKEATFPGSHPEYSQESTDASFPLLSSPSLQLPEVVEQRSHPAGPRGLPKPHNCSDESK